MAAQQAIGRGRHSKAIRTPRAYGITHGPHGQESAVPWSIKWLPLLQDVRGMCNTRHHCVAETSRAPGEDRQTVTGW